MMIVYFLKAMILYTFIFVILSIASYLVYDSVNIFFVAFISAISNILVAIIM